MFNLDQFVADCHASLADRSRKALVDVVKRSVSAPHSVMRAIGEPERAGVRRLHVAPDLTILNLVWGPGMTIRPHNHAMWAVIGVYTGREDNIFWRRVPGSPAGVVEAAAARSVGPGETVLLGRDIIHSVVNPLGRLTGAIHIYGGDFFTAERSEWDPETLREKPYDVQATLDLFETANARLPA